MPEWLLSACMQMRSRQAEDSVPRRQRTPLNADPDSLRLVRAVRACQNLTAWTASLWTVLEPASPRFALCDPAACSVFAGLCRTCSPKRGPWI